MKAIETRFNMMLYVDSEGVFEIIDHEEGYDELVKTISRKGVKLHGVPIIRGIYICHILRTTREGKIDGEVNELFDKDKLDVVDVKTIRLYKS